MNCRLKEREWFAEAASSQDREIIGLELELDQIRHEPRQIILISNERWPIAHLPYYGKRLYSDISHNNVSGIHNCFV